MIETFEHEYEVYKIGNADNNYRIEKVGYNNIYKGDGSYRKAIASPYRVNAGRNTFVDDSFRFQITADHCNERGQPFVYRRIYEIYDQEFNIFQDELMKEVPLKKQKFYPTFMSQFSMIDKQYIKTRFFTKMINEKGLYQYFVRRNGQYYVQFMDDLIPVDPETMLPPWGLRQQEPWKIIVMKAWLKQKRSITALINAEPYEFIEAFGFPGYRTIALQKDINHIVASKVKAETKKARESRIPLDMPGFIIVGKTRDNEQIQNLGLIPNRAGYRICRTKFQNKSVISSEIRGSHVSSLSEKDNSGQDNIYKVHSSLPSAWVGSYSVFAKNSKLMHPDYAKMQQDLYNVQYEFLATYNEISRVFSKFYICPEYDSNKYMGGTIEDSISVDVGSAQNPFYFFELRIGKEGFMNLNIQLPIDSGQFKNQQGNTTSNRRFSYIKYLLARKKGEVNKQALQGYDYYDGQYVKGYHKSVNRFIQVQRGVYYIYFKVERNKSLSNKHRIAININTNANVESFKQIDHRNPNYDFSYVMMSALHNYNIRYGLKAYVGKEAQQKKQLVIYFAHSFDDIGFACISIHSKPPTKTFLAMNIFNAEFINKQMTICHDIHKLQHIEEEQTINFVAKEGETKILVIERSIRARHTSGDKFPPEGAVDFYHVM